MRSSTPARSSKPWNGAEVANIEFVDGTDLGRGRRMEHGRDRRCESGSKLASA